MGGVGVVGGRNERAGISTASASVHDLAITGLILSVAGSAWFGWGRQDPPSGWSIPLLLGSLVGLGFAIAGGVLLWRLRSSGGSAMNNPRIRRSWRLIVGVEVVAILLGNVLLGLSGRPAYAAGIPITARRPHPPYCWRSSSSRRSPSRWSS
jgi:hypothetical protein